MSSSSTRVLQQAKTRLQVECFVKLLRLKRNKEYLETANRIRSLELQFNESNSRLIAAKSAYIPYLNKRPDLQKQFRAAERIANEAESVLEDEKDTACQRLGLVQWCPPEVNVSVEDAVCFIQPLRPVVLMEPSVERRIDLNADVDKEMRRKLDTEGEAEEPPRKYTMADKDGWLTMKINIRAPLPELEEAIKILLRQHRWEIPKTRNRPDKAKAALEAFVCYQETPSFSVIAKQLGRRVSTVKGQYVRACVLVHDQRPSGTIKQRRAARIQDPGMEFLNHYGSCSRCQKADSANKMCDTFRAYVDQDTKNDLDRRASRVKVEYGTTGRRTPRRSTADHAQDFN